MRLCVFGLWHLGTVTAACLAQKGHQVIGLDLNENIVDGLRAGKAPLFEPDLEVLIQSGIGKGTLSFTQDPQEALQNVDLVWITFDTPVDQDDRADPDFVVRQVETLFPYLAKAKLVLVSSQLPVGSTSRIRDIYRAQYPDGMVNFGCSPENLRLGKAIQAFMQPDRVVVGLEKESSRPIIEELFSPITHDIVWMSVESAEMTKHALNALLATSVAFINEIAVVCEHVGADASQVEQGLKSDVRIGHGMYLKPGAAFAGGTLARDIRFLQHIGQEHGLPVDLINGVAQSNQGHRDWAYLRLNTLLGSLQGKTIVVLGLTYKPNTDTLRQSAAIVLCRQLIAEGAIVRVHDPVVRILPDDLTAQVRQFEKAVDALEGADAVVISTEWTDYRELSASQFLSQMDTPLVLDANRFLQVALDNNPKIRYFVVGKPDESATS